MGTLARGPRLKQPTTNNVRKSDCVAKHTDLVYLGIMGVGGWLIGGWMVGGYLLVVVGCRSCVRSWMVCWRYVCLGIMVVGGWLIVGCLLFAVDWWGVGEQPP